MVWITPLFAWFGYHAIVLLIVFCGPIDWDIPNASQLIGFIAACNLVFAIGYFSAARVKPKPASTDVTLILLKIGILLTIVLLIPNLYLYTGKGVEDVFDAAVDQGEAWKQTQSAIVERSGSRTWFALLRGLSAPFTLSVIPIFVLRWPVLGYGWRILGIVALLSILTFSIARGTDKETIELALLIGFGLFAYSLIRKKSAHLFSWRAITSSMVMVCIALIAFSLFSERKSQRLGDAWVFCQPITSACADTSHPTLYWVPEDSQFAVSLVANYLGQGFYGLSLALEETFDSTFGIGHSSFVMSQIERYSSSPDFLDRSFIYKIDERGWPRKTSWSSAYTWIANDLSFIGTVIAMFLWGFLLSVAWRDFMREENYSAYLVCVCYVITLFYIPMNFQITQTIDYYFPAITWTLMWLGTRGLRQER